MSVAATPSLSELRMLENCLRFLAACFYEPEKDLFLEENLFENLGTCLAVVCPEAAGYAEEMDVAMRSTDPEELRVAYAKLFVGPFELAAPPYGSVYLDEGRRVMGDSTMAVIAVYEEEGLSRSEHCKDLPDHIAVELEFVGYLVTKELGALEKEEFEQARAWSEKRDSFVERYLRTWVPEFCEAITDHTENGFYAVLASCLFRVSETI